MLMTMDCPRCGFNQPRDRFCANCGLNVEVALAQKPPLWRRVSSSPSFYLTLTGILVALLVVFVITTRVPALLRATRGAPVSSREAGDPKLAAIADDATPPANEPDEPEANVAVEPTPPPAPVVTAAVAASTAPEYKRFETEFYELGHDQTAALIAGGERVGEDTGGRAYLIHDAAKLTEVFRTGARSLGPGFRDPLRTDGPQLIATPPTASEGLRYDLMLQLTKFENNRAAFRFSSALAMTPPETDAERLAGPSFKPVIETTLGGTFELGGTDVLLIVIEAPNRRPRREFMTKAGPGPWSIFASPNFAVGETEWVATVRLK